MSSVGAESVLRGLRPLPPFPVIRVARPEQSHKRRYVIARKGTGTSRCCPDSSRADLCSSQVASHAIGRSGSSQAAPSQDGFASALQAARPFGPSLARTHLVPLEPLPFAPLMPCRILAHASRASWSKRKNSPVGRFGCDPFLAEGVFSRDGDAADEKPGRRRRRHRRLLERASEPCCWMDQEADASDASFFQVASCARRGNIYLPDGVCPSTQDATNEFHLGQDTRVYDGISFPSPTATVS